jgi:imidazole glycerol-phosphate synthase subunit HisF
MFRPRIIPVLLLKDEFLVKSKQFKNYVYIGDAINAVKLFNDFKADELILLDILATQNNRITNIDFVKTIAEETTMPFAIGGGIKTVEQINELITAGAEKVIINSEAAVNPNFIKEAVNIFGSSAITVCIDIKKNIWGKQKVYTKNGTQSTKYSGIDFALLMEDCGAGEIIVQSILSDGMMNGYNLELIKKIAEALTIPIIALGGAGNISHLKQAFDNSFASGLAASSMFIFQSTERGVLINYPSKNETKFN